MKELVEFVNGVNPDTEFIIHVDFKEEGDLDIGE